MSIEAKRLTLNNCGDDAGVLLLREGVVVAMLAQLSDLHDENVGAWFVEWAGGDSGYEGHLYATLEAACAAFNPLEAAPRRSPSHLNIEA